jgi:ribosome-associated translation inhibitor RaiA
VEPLRVTFRNLDPSAAVEDAVRERADKLEELCDRIQHCRVVVEASDRRHHRGRLYQVRLTLRLPGEELVVRADGDADHAHEDVYVAVRDAFDAARRQLQAWVQRHRGQVKTHEPA